MGHFPLGCSHTCIPQLEMEGLDAWALTAGAPPVPGEGLATPAVNYLLGPEVRGMAVTRVPCVT